MAQHDHHDRYPRDNVAALTLTQLGNTLGIYARHVSSARWTSHDRLVQNRDITMYIVTAMHPKGLIAAHGRGLLAPVMLNVRITYTSGRASPPLPPQSPSSPRC